MLHPVGRLPESTYWRRRTTVVLALVLTAVLVKSVLLSGGNSDAATSPAGGDRAGAASPGATSPTAAPASSSSPSPSPSLSPAAVPSARAKPRASKPVRSTSPTSKAAAKHGPLPTCATRSLALFVGAARDYYRVGQIADLTLSVANVSDSSCRDDIGPKVQEALVYKGNHRLWSSNDCYPGSESDVVTLRPGELHRLVIRWSGDSSKPGCAGKRARIGAGTYTVIGHVGKLEKRGVLVLRG